uniref:Uncharacterized protein n=1 Tax=Anguilla anguilla TaxID=7936 RepID=A0A0E9PCQ3_ANGAN
MASQNVRSENVKLCHGAIITLSNKQSIILNIHSVKLRVHLSLLKEL